MAGLSQEGATVLGNAVGFHFPPGLATYGTALGLAAGDVPIEGD